MSLAAVECGRMNPRLPPHPQKVLLTPRPLVAQVILPPVTF